MFLEKANGEKQKTLKRFKDYIERMIIFPEGVNDISNVNNNNFSS